MSSECSSQQLPSSSCARTSLIGINYTSRKKTGHRGQDGSESMWIFCTNTCLYVCICPNMFASCGLIGCTSYRKLASCVFLPWTSTTQLPNRNLTTFTAAVNLFWMGEKNNTFSALTVLTWTWVSRHGSLCAWKICLSLWYCAIILNDATPVSLTNWEMRFLKTQPDFTEVHVSAVCWAKALMQPFKSVMCVAVLSLTGWRGPQT